MSESAEVTTLATIPAEQPSPMQLISQALEKGTNPADMTALYDLHERHEANEARKAYIKAVVGFQSECPVIQRVKKGDKSTYTPYDFLMKTIKPLLQKWGLSIQADTKTKVTPTKYETGKRKGHDTVVGHMDATIIVGHRDGHTERFSFTIPVDPEMWANDSQKVGSANSYAKRYGVTNALNIITSDDVDNDGAGDENRPIDEETAILFRERLEACDADIGAFCRFLKIESLEVMPAKLIARADNAIKQKEAKA